MNTTAIIGSGQATSTAGAHRAGPATGRLPGAPVHPAGVEDAAGCIEVLLRAFAGDPGVRWMFPRDRQYRTHFPAFARAFGGGAFAQGTALRTEGFAAAALWLLPHAHPDEEALGALIGQGVPPGLREAVLAVFEQLAAHHPAEPHWHLPLIGADPAWRGRGLGSALLGRGLQLCDRDRAPAYLEATSPRSVPLYERHGFAVLGVVRVGGSPPIVPMLRQQPR